MEYQKSHYFVVHISDAAATIVLCHVQDWERCERGIGGSLEKLRAFKRQLSQPLPDHHEDLQAEQMRCEVTAWRHFFYNIIKWKLT